jgi:hypothetical protein
MNPLHPAGIGKAQARFYSCSPSPYPSGEVLLIEQNPQNAGKAIILPNS